MLQHVAPLVPPRGFGQGVGSPAVAGPIFGDRMFSSAGFSQLFASLRPRLRTLDVVPVLVLLQCFPYLMWLNEAVSFGVSL